MPFNETRLQDQTQEQKEIQQSVKLIENVINNKMLSADEAQGLLRVVTDYTYVLDILDVYGHQRLQVNNFCK
ncbi:hypothetical protein [Nafulsella turpanensis]|uniref:hypothetical protein n=1 Tax=Nafulsella turpanensis TaxID=1265690 RepID=UPI00034CC185